VTNTAPTFIIVLIEPKYSGNIGAVARAMMNFNLQQLILVNPCPLNDECYARAMHATSILDNAKIFTTFQEAVSQLDFTVATSSIQTVSDKKHLRNPIDIEEFSEKIQQVQGNVGILFGREDYGLFNEEIAAADIMIKIPTDPSYLSLNLSHSVAVILYSLYIHQKDIIKKRRIIGPTEKQRLYLFFDQLLKEINYPQHKKQNTEILFKRLMGRAIPSKWEYHTLMGVFNKTIEQLQKKKID
jgi:TrmH family RNA methyltransferase